MDSSTTLMIKKPINLLPKFKMRAQCSKQLSVLKNVILVLVYCLVFNLQDRKQYLIVSRDVSCSLRL